jgi:hypothetical protein
MATSPDATAKQLDRLLARLAAAQKAYASQISRSVDATAQSPYAGTLVELCEDSMAPGGVSCTSAKGMCGAPTITFNEYEAGVSGGAAQGTQASLYDALNTCAADTDCATFAGRSDGPYTLSGDGARLLTGANLDHSAQPTAKGVRAFVKSGMIPVPASLAPVSSREMGVPTKTEYVKVVGTRVLDDSQMQSQLAGRTVAGSPPSVSAETTGGLDAQTVRGLLSAASGGPPGTSVAVGPEGGWLLSPAALLPSPGWTAYVRKDVYANLRRLDGEKASTQPCAADHGSKQACCGQPGAQVADAYVCPAEAPTCSEYVYGHKWGHCVPSPPDTVTSWKAGADSNLMKKACPVTCEAPCGHYYYVTAKGVVRPVPAALGTCGHKPVRVKTGKHAFLAQRGLSLGPAISAASDCAIDPLDQKGKADVDAALAAVNALGAQISQRVKALRLQEATAFKQVGVTQGKYKRAIRQYERMEKRLGTATGRAGVARQMSADYLALSRSTSMRTGALVVGLVVVASGIVWLANRPVAPKISRPLY